ncbi:hypothetical protein DAEQUDRAFT_337507 [Daedalea quercina L-15889]|uniref:DUF1793-domain-containing protein n=1 Tax=Daedalea quercina L-15889 TaxID=1314783 RepID=A0A165PJ97_9APHY|nr:hypothetical protein DAEQUDRAFT_337507 [Daedalea quercina L-15889]
MTFFVLASFLFLLHITLLHAHGAQTFWPVAIPLAVRTPYLNTWMFAQNTTTTSNDWPSFWNGQILGWICYIRVDGKTYTLFGNNNLASSYNISAGTVLETELTPTRTIQVIEAGPMNVTLTFLSPIDPSDLVFQSLPLSYTSVNFTSTDGQPHDIQLYADLTGEWLYGGGQSPRSTQMMTWSSTQTSGMIYHQFQLQDPAAFQENDGQASDGTAYHAMALGQNQNISWQTCEDTVCRPEFVLAGGVNSKNDNNTFRNITDDWPIFPISINLGSVASPSTPVVWTVGYVRDPSISYTLSGQTTSLRPYYTTQYSTLEAALEDFVSNYDNSLSQAMALDERIREEALNISADGKLYDMLSLATRQVFSSLEITAPESAGGQARIFMKDMGLTNRVTPVENLYAALPMFLYFNASLVKPLLVPLLEQQNSSLGSFPSAASDIGSTFPTVSGPNLDPNEAIEQTSNMLILALAHAHFSNDTSLLQDYYDVLTVWEENLEQNALYPSGQVSIDDGATYTNSSNLALKGIYAIQAMAQISQLVGQKDDYQSYNSTASAFINTWQSLALPSDDDPIVLTTYRGAQYTWSLPYNLYPQTLFGFNLLNETILEKLTVSYGQMLEPSSSYGFKYGLPIDSAYNSHGDAAWNAFMAAAFAGTNDTLSSQIFDTLWEYASNNETSMPFGTIYSVESGKYINGTSNPSLGGLFAPFVRSGVAASSTDGQGGSGSTPLAGGSSHSTNTGAIVGGVVGGVLGLLVLLGLLFWLLRRRRTRKTNIDLLDTSGTRTEPTPYQPAPANAPQTPLVLMSEKRQREIAEREGLPLLPKSSTAPYSTVSDAPQSTSGSASAGGTLPSTLSSDSSRSRQDELLGLRSDIENLRRIMLSVHVERPEPSDLGAPPEYHDS